MYSSGFPTFSADGRFAFSSLAFSDAVVALRHDKRTGLLRQIGKPVCAQREVDHSDEPCAGVGGRTAPITVAPGGRHLYLSDSVRDDIALFEAEPRSGALRARPGALGCTRGARRGPAPCRDEIGASSLLLTPDGRFAYQVLGQKVLAYHRDAASGVLELLAGRDGCLSATPKPTCHTARRLAYPDDLTLSPDGRYAYVSTWLGTWGPGSPRERILVLAREPGPDR